MIKLKIIVAMAAFVTAGFSSTPDANQTSDETSPQIVEEVVEHGQEETSIAQAEPLETKEEAKITKSLKATYGDKPSSEEREAYLKSIGL